MVNTQYLEIPLTYDSNVLEKKKTAVQKFTVANEEIKVNMYEFSNDKEESAELFLCLVKDFLNMVKTYELFTVPTTAKVIDRFRRCLSGTALDDWDLTRDIHSANTRPAFKLCVHEIIEELLDEDAVINTKQYLKRTKKP